MVVIITGASRGIGFATAKYFAAMKHCEIYALSRNKAGLGQLATECAGLSKSSQVRPMVFDLDEFLLNPEKTLKKLNYFESSKSSERFIITLTLVSKLISTNYFAFFNFEFKYLFFL